MMKRFVVKSILWLIGIPIVVVGIFTAGCIVWSCLIFSDSKQHEITGMLCQKLIKDDIISSKLKKENNNLVNVFRGYEVRGYCVQLWTKQRIQNKSFFINYIDELFKKHGVKITRIEFGVGSEPSDEQIYFVYKFEP